MPELWASVKKLRSSRLYCDKEAGLAQDSHWIAEPRGSERSTGSAVQVAVRRVGGLSKEQKGVASRECSAGGCEARRELPSGDL